MAASSLADYGDPLAGCRFAICCDVADAATNSVSAFDRQRTGAQRASAAGIDHSGAGDSLARISLDIEAAFKLSPRPISLCGMSGSERIKGGKLRFQILNQSACEQSHDAAGASKITALRVKRCAHWPPVIGQGVDDDRAMSVQAQLEGGVQSDRTGAYDDHGGD